MDTIFPTSLEDFDRQPPQPQLFDRVIPESHLDAYLSFKPVLDAYKDRIRSEKLSRWKKYITQQVKILLYPGSGKETDALGIFLANNANLTSLQEAFNLFKKKVIDSNLHELIQNYKNALDNAASEDTDVKIYLDNYNEAALKKTFTIQFLDFENLLNRIQLMTSN